MSDFPVLVERYTAEQALTIVCERCYAEAVIDADDLLNEGLYECPADTERARRASTEERCRSSAVMKYEEADKCKGCGELGFFDKVLGYCCSRKCMLQAEYAAQLAEMRP